MQEPPYANADRHVAGKPVHLRPQLGAATLHPSPKTGKSSLSAEGCQQSYPDQTIWAGTVAAQQGWSRSLRNTIHLPNPKVRYVYEKQHVRRHHSAKLPAHFPLHRAHLAASIHSLQDDLVPTLSILPVGALEYRSLYA